MSPTQEALLIGTAAIALLAVVPFVILRRRSDCSLRQQGRGA